METLYNIKVRVVSYNSPVNPWERETWTVKVVDSKNVPSCFINGEYTIDNSATIMNKDFRPRVGVFAEMKYMGTPDEKLLWHLFPIKK